MKLHKFKLQVLNNYNYICALVFINVNHYKNGALGILVVIHLYKP